VILKIFHFKKYRNDDTEEKKELLNDIIISIRAKEKFKQSEINEDRINT